MDFRESPEHARFRLEVRAWLEANLPPGWGKLAHRGPESAAERMRFTRWWQRRLFDGGWAGLAWPKEHGGRELGLVEQTIWSEEYARAWAPDLISLGVGIALTGPVLMAKGKEWQRRAFLKKILTGEHIWCQGFSEPGAGSDLAALRTRGELEGECIVVTGQKIWTSFAQFADWCILVVRTDPEARRKHDGLTFLLVDMQSPGIEIRPLKEMTGEDWFNEVFFDRVRVPVRNVVGEIGGGWEVVVNTLAHERVSAAPHARLEAQLGLLRELARRTPRGRGVAADDPVVRQQLARFTIEVTALRLNAYRNIASIERTGHPGPQGSTQKLGWSELEQRVQDLAGRILGPAGLLLPGDALAPDGGHWAHEQLWSRAATLYAGTSEVQRNIVAERVLGLPR
jgi:alkylation response protein AidB-like acyl-CoA dehydrogenase